MYIKQQLNLAIKETYYKKYSDLPKSFLNDYNAFLIHVRLKEDMETIDLLEDYLGFNQELQSVIGHMCQSTQWGFGIRVERSFFRSEPAQEVVDVLKQEPEDSYLVGGAVRDAILETGYNTPKDWDFATSIPYDRLTVIFKKAGYKVQEEGKQFLVLIVSKDGHQFEIANFRKDGTYKDGRRPESVDIGTMEDDANRRDFTINALYFNIKTLKLVDPTGCGILDIEEKMLRFVGNPNDRLAEDALRAWRFMRFVKKLGFKAHPKSARAIKSNFKDIYEKSNPQRVLQEMSKFINLDNK